MARDRRLPVLEPPPASEATSCGPKVYVSNEESMLLATMRRVRADAVALRQALAAAVDPPVRAALADRLAALRTEWDDLARSREAAYHRKMVMLGHAEPDIEWPAP